MKGISAISRGHQSTSSGADSGDYAGPQKYKLGGGRVAGARSPGSPWPRQPPGIEYYLDMLHKSFDVAISLFEASQTSRTVLGAKVAKRLREQYYKEDIGFHSSKVTPHWAKNWSTLLIDRL